MVGYLQPLDEKFPIVGPDGKPTLYFIRWAQQKQIDIGEARSGEQVQGLIDQFMEEHHLQAGSGITLTPDGNLLNSPEISADVQEILDQLSTARGSVLFRGASGWQALPPGTSTQYLKSNGPSSDPVWQTPSGGGGSEWAEIFLWDYSVDGGKSSLTIDISAYSEVVIEGQNVSCSDSTWRVARFSTDGGLTYHTDSPWALSEAGVVSTRTDTALYFHGTASAAARTWFLAAYQINIAGAFKEIRSIRAATTGYYGLSSSGSLGAITHVQIYPATTLAVPLGTFNGGTIRVLAR